MHDETTWNYCTTYHYLPLAPSVWTSLNTLFHCYPLHPSLSHHIPIAAPPGGFVFAQHAMAHPSAPSSPLPDPTDSRDNAAVDDLKTAPGVTCRYRHHAKDRNKCRTHGHLEYIYIYSIYTAVYIHTYIYYINIKFIQIHTHIHIT